MKESIKEKEDVGKMRGFSRITAVVIIIIAIVAILVFLLLFRLNFMVGEQLRITVTPEYSEIQTISPGSVPFEVDVKLYNKYVCNAICIYTLTDMSYDTLLDNGTLNSKAYKSKFYSFNIPINYYGSGTNTYLYRLECRNIRTTLCPANDDVLVRKSLLTVTYNPSEEQLAAKTFLEKNYAIISENIVNASKLLNSAEIIINSLNNSNIVLNASQYYALKSDRDVLLESVDGLMSLWKNNDFIDTKSYIVDIKLLDRTTNLLSSTIQYDNYLISSTEDYNSLLTELVSLHSVLQEYRKILSLNVFSINASTKQSMLRAIVSGNNYINQFENKSYDPGLLYHNVLELENTTAEINKLVVNGANAELSRDLPSIYIYSKMLCVKDGKNDTNITKSTFNTCNFDYSLNVSNIIDASTKLTNICSRANIIENIMGNYDFSANDSKETLLLQYKLLIDYESMIIGTGNTASNPILTYYSTYLRDSLSNLYNIIDPETLIYTITFDSESELKFNKNNLIFADIKDIDELCDSTASVPNLKNLTVNYLPIPVLNLSNSEKIIMVATPEITPECCMYGKCQSCESKSKKNPLILLHGHSFNKDVHAYQSVETFNSFDQAFKEDKLYFQTGLLVNNVNSNSGVLGQFNIPPVSKPTYYLETYNSLLGLTVSESKTGNIDTYALRLKENIDHTMYISGSNKVDIIAHSMGGLVVRRYIQIFGAQNLGTVILIGTPNNGISEKTYTLCKIFGAVNECEDMRASGIFIKKLNDYANQPDIKNLYLVVGRGCDTDGEDGDGVVAVNNSLIKNFPDSRVLYVDGECSGTNLLHGDMLDVSTHPEVYEFVKEKLKQN